MQRGRLFIGIGLAVVVAGCGGGAATPSIAGSSPPAASGTAPDACALLTEAEVSAALGETVSAGVLSGINAPSCNWQDANGGGATLDYPTEPSMVGTIAPGEAGNSAITLTPVTGLGDAAAYTADGTIGADLAVRKGRQAFDISVSEQLPYSLAQAEAAEKVLAQAALARLP